MIRYRKLGTQLKELARIQDNVEQSFLALNEEPFIRGRIISGVELSTSETTIQTGLKRPIQGWILIDKDADQNVYRAVNAAPGVLDLVATGAVTVSLWVF